MKLREIKELKGKIIIKTGLHIGAGNDEINIGGIDNPVVKDPITGYPYIPGSSLKGKVRTLLEWYKGYVNQDGSPYSTKDSNNPIARIFGNGKNESEYKGGPTRVSFSDCRLLNAKELIEKDALTESKVEVSIDRTKGTASKAGPRHMERVPAGAVFEFYLTYKVFDEHDEKNFELLLQGLKLLEMDALGGSGSRGYGKIKFEFDDEEIAKKFQEIKF
ncbi:type III-A CRISPR-associated RAMP protein Csm3 [Deferribacter abyssi]|uniref:type III-A CRISPR-associated RAMP protein Csm3 n=1 Tax=Deferribacter abyssi TaxID=213806 RepID=UPI003C1EB6D1